MTKIPNKLTPGKARDFKKGDLLIYRPGIWQQLVKFERVAKDLQTDYIHTQSITGLPSDFIMPNAEDLIEHQEIEITRLAIAELKKCSYCSSDMNKGWVLEKSVGNVEGYCQFNCGVKKGFSEVSFVQNAYQMDWSGVGPQAILFGK